MKYYQFKTFVTSYFFPKVNEDTDFLYFLYGNYGGWQAKLYWWLFRKCWIVRHINSVDSSEIEDFDLINKLVGEDAIFAINYGTPNQEQKKSILGIDTKKDMKFFAKFAVKKDAMALTKNEIYVYDILSGTGLVPMTYKTVIETEYVFLKCEYLQGKHIHNDIPKDAIMSILAKMRMRHYQETDKWSHFHHLETSLAHCDFCLWNMIETENGIRLIDWELAQERPLGFDLFTYVFLGNYAQNHNLTNEMIWNQYQDLVEDYFKSADIKDWLPYLNAFVDIKLAWQKGRSDQFYYGKLMSLREFANKEINEK